MAALNGQNQKPIKASRALERGVGAVAVAVLVALVVHDLSHVYKARQLLEKRDALVAAQRAQIEQDTELMSRCQWILEDQAQIYATCLREGLPQLKSALGMLNGVMKAGSLLSRLPDDKATQAVAVATMDRAWDQYWRVDRPAYRMADEASDELNESLLYRIGHPPSNGGQEAEWTHLLTSAEVLVSDPVLAKKQFDRHFSYESQDAQAYAAARAHAIK